MPAHFRGELSPRSSRRHCPREFPAYDREGSEEHGLRPPRDVGIERTIQPRKEWTGHRGFWPGPSSEFSTTAADLAARSIPDEGSVEMDVICWRRFGSAPKCLALSCPSAVSRARVGWVCGIVDEFVVVGR